MLEMSRVYIIILRVYSQTQTIIKKKKIIKPETKRVFEQIKIGTETNTGRG